MALESRNTWSTISAVTVAFLVAITAVAFTTGLWVLTAIPVGFLFGFFQEKSDLCGSSAFSEVIMMKERSKVTGIWVIIAVSMAVFTVGSALGWIRLNPKPLLWASYLVGGAVFGVGMVLAGGCVSGTLFKTGQGNLNSMAALVAIPIGIAAVAYGPLHGFHQSLKSNIVSSVEGGPVTLASVTGAPFWLLALIIAAATLAVAILLRGRGRAKKESPVTERIGDRSSLLKRVMTRPWKPWQSGVAIGVLALAAYASSAASGRNYPLGVTHGVLHVELLATDSPVKHVWQKQPKPSVPPDGSEGQPSKKVVWWLIALVTFVVVGSHVSARLRGSFKLAPKPPDETIIAFFGGLLVGAGAALAGGCVVGNIMSGVALMSVGNMLFVIVVVLANWATTYLYMIGWRS